MPVPDSLTAWREFVARRNVEPEQLSREKIAALSEEDKAAYDKSRFAWIGADVVIETKDLASIERQVHRSSPGKWCISLPLKQCA
ncbi:hypothetical protein [Corynebacterium variabile]|uniref:hypothetical protein n=1 Tax=Corynebacterium variabile TaxID=1727 RepID=UPI003BAE41DD